MSTATGSPRAASTSAVPSAQASSLPKPATELRLLGDRPARPSTARYRSLPSGVDDDRDDQRAAAVVAVRPAGRRRGAISCSSWCAVADALLGRACASAFSITRDDGVEGVLVVHEAAGQEVRRLGQLAGVGVDDGDDGDRRPPRRGCGGPSATPRWRRRRSCRRRRRCPPATLPVILARPSTRSTTTPSSAMTTPLRGATPVRIARSPLARRCRHSPCTGMTLRGLDDVVAVDELAGAGVAGDVHLGVALVDDVARPSGSAR